MTGRVLIADDVATNRIILKVKLAASRYDVMQADCVRSLLMQARADMPDLIIVTQNLPGGGVKAACAGLRADPGLANIPVISVSPTSNHHDRLAGLAAGADEVLIKPLDEVALLALVRNLIRTRNAIAELQHKQTIAREFGFSDKSQSFTRRARIALVPNKRETGFAWRTGLVGQLKDDVSVLTKAEALDDVEPDKATDVFVISARLNTGTDGLHLVSELRSRPVGRHAVMVVHNPTHDAKITTLALDMGADAVLCGDFDGEELAIRLSRLAPRKLASDDLRASLDQQLSMAMTDPLTGLYNRRYAQSYLARMLQSSQTKGAPFTLMVLDLDRFKLVNDRFGHAVGDEVLIEVAKRLKTSMREVDLLARMGGEEFLIALPDTGRGNAARAAERLRRIIGEHPIRTQSQQFNVSVTMSIGVVVSDENGDAAEKIDQLIERADKALYASKSEGRNQVTFVRSAA